jgi:hypothetical protein
MPRRIDRIISVSKQDEDEIIFNIGEALQYEYAPKGIRYQAPYSRMGKELWIAVQYDLYNIICDPKAKEPRLFIEELISGDVRDLGISIFTILVSQLSIPAAIAIPIVALVLKAGLRKYCGLEPERPRRSYIEILSSKKNQMEVVKKRKKNKDKPAQKRASRR